MTENSYPTIHTESRSEMVNAGTVIQDDMAQPCRNDHSCVIYLLLILNVLFISGLGVFFKSASHITVDPDMVSQCI